MAKKLAKRQFLGGKARFFVVFDLCLKKKQASAEGSRQCQGGRSHPFSPLTKEAILRA
jgi:hypothetical protein